MLIQPRKKTQTRRQCLLRNINCRTAILLLLPRKQRVIQTCHAHRCPVDYFESLYSITKALQRGRVYHRRIVCQNARTPAYIIRVCAGMENLRVILQERRARACCCRCSFFETMSSRRRRRCCRPLAGRAIKTDAISPGGRARARITGRQHARI